MNGAGLSPAPGITQRGLMLAAIVSLHVLIINLLVVVAGSSSRFDDPVLEADVLPGDRRLTGPPPFPNIVFQASSPLELPVIAVVIDAAGAQELPPTSGAEKVDLRAEVFTTENPPPEIDPVPVLSPRPISGPRGIDRYPKE